MTHMCCLPLKHARVGGPRAASDCRRLLVMTPATAITPEMSLDVNTQSRYTVR